MKQKKLVDKRVIKYDNSLGRWKVLFFNKKVEAEALAFPEGILANFIHILEMMESEGPNLGKPYVGKIGDGLFEIRSKGKEGIGRSIYCAQSGKEIVILHSFVKKSAKTPKKELDIARKRMKELKDETPNTSRVQRESP